MEYNTMKETPLTDLLGRKERSMLGSAHISVCQVPASFWVLICKTGVEQKEGMAGRQGPIKRNCTYRDSGIPTTHGPGW